MSESTSDKPRTPILELDEIGFAIDGADGDEVHLLDEISLSVDRGHFMAIVGPSGCGKTTLLKTIAGITENTEGRTLWKGRDLEDDDFYPSEVSYVPQFSIAYDEMTVGESVECAARLQVQGTLDELDDIIDEALERTGLTEIEDRFVKVLSGGQRRRLGLAMELVADPDLLLCDEVTSGLDPKSENEIVRLLHELSRSGKGRVVASVTHSLSNLELYDSVLVLFAGRVVFHGPPRALCHYFSVDSVEDVYPRLAKRKPDDWHESWGRHRRDYYGKLGVNKMVVPRDGTSADRDLDLEEAEARGWDYIDREWKEPTEIAEVPGFFTQLSVLFARRWKRFFRDRTQLFLHVALLVGFPILVVLFAPNGIGNVERLPDSISENMREEAETQMRFLSHKLKIGKLVSGIVMFQVVLLTLMGANNSAREIAGERAIFEKEKFAGLRPSAYLVSKILFLSVLVAAQALWMGIFVDVFAGLPGPPMVRYSLLLLVCGAMTSICLGISALMKSADQANLLSIYLVGFQLPLSGAILGLPKVIEPFLQPFISAFWGWAGNLSSMKSEKVYDAVKEVSETDLEPMRASLCLLALGAHLALGILMCVVGLAKNRWEH